MNNDVYRLEIEHANRRRIPAEHIGIEYISIASSDDTLPRRQEKLALIRLLRDQTHSKEIFDRCVAIVGRE